MTNDTFHADRDNDNRPLRPSAEQLTEQNVETITRLDEAAREQRTPTDRLAEKIAKFWAKRLNRKD